MPQVHAQISLPVQYWCVDPPPMNYCMQATGSSGYLIGRGMHPSAEFCSGCGVEPYHYGFDCQSFTAYLAG